MIAMNGSESSADCERSGRVREIGEILCEVLAGYKVSEPILVNGTMPTTARRFEPLVEGAAAAAH